MNQERIKLSKDKKCAVDCTVSGLEFTEPWIRLNQGT